MKLLSGSYHWFDGDQDGESPLSDVEITVGTSVPKLCFKCNPFEYAELDLTPDAIRFLEKAIRLAKNPEFLNGSIN